MHRVIMSLFALFLSLGLSTVAQADSTESAPISRIGSLPEPTHADLVGVSRPYRIGPLDKLEYTVYGIQDLSSEVQADISGNISVPLVGVIMAAGKTPGELAAEIATGLRAQYVRNPQVTVNVKEIVSQIVTVDGEVGQPGTYPVLGDMTLMRSVASARGISENAKLQDVVIFRTIEGQRYAGLYNLKAIRRGTYSDPAVFANDIVVVGDSKARRLFKDLIQLAPALLTPIIILLTR